MRIDTEIEIGRLGHRRAKRAIGGDPVDCRSARLVIGDYNVVPRDIDGHENRPCSQRNRLAMRLQCSTRGIDAKCRHPVLAGCASRRCCSR